MAEPVLEVEDLAVAWGARVAVSGVSFVLRPGEVLGLVGESGSGKSTLARGLLRLLPPPARVVGGRVRLQGAELLRADEATLRGWWGRAVGVVPQAAQSAFDPRLTLRSHFGEALRAHGVSGGSSSTSKVERAMTRALLPLDLLDRWPHQLSGGQRQRAALALALLHEPPLLVLDEPTSALDVIVARELLVLLHDLQRSLGLAVLLVTHELAVLRRLADRAVVLYGGRVMEQGLVSEVVTAPRHPYTQAWVAAAPAPLDQPPGPGSVWVDAPPAETGCPFVPRCPTREARCGQPPALRSRAGGAEERRVACHRSEP